MPLIQILSYSQKKEFEIPLVLNNESREEVFSLPPPIERQMVAIDKAINKARFIAMFGYFKVMNHLQITKNNPQFKLN